jgi:hypothetical protein
VAPITVILVVPPVLLALPPVAELEFQFEILFERLLMASARASADESEVEEL